MANYLQLEPSKLGTKKHWDGVYEEELRNFQDAGDEGEIWFGQETVEKMVDWAFEHIPPSSNPSVVELGSGNGTLLFALSEAGYKGSQLSGIDYSSGAVELAKSIAMFRDQRVTFNVTDFLYEDPPLLPNMHDHPEGTWDLVLDKGTFDAVSLMNKDKNGRLPALKYPGRVAQVLAPGGLFLITSCNFTEEELRMHFTAESSGLEYHSHIKHPTFEFGGGKGSAVASVAFRKMSN